MAPRPPLSKAEMEVARLVWRLGGATVRQVLEAMPKSKQMQYKTLQTYLRRLESKGYVKARKEGRSTFYSPCVRPGQVIRETVGDLVNRLFDGEPFPLVEHLIREQGIDQDDLTKLRELLNQLEAEQGDA